MRIPRSPLWAFFLVITSTSAAISRNLQSSTPRNAPQHNETVKHLPPSANITDVLDVRTPPKIKQMMKKHEQKAQEPVENSHPGIAEPVDADSISVGDSSKKANVYKTETKTSTDSGLSTWILLSGQTISSTSKPIRNNISKTSNETKNITIGNSNRIVKPVFKKRPNIVGETSSTFKPPNKEIRTTTTQRTASSTEKTTKIMTEASPLISSSTESFPVSSTTIEVTKLTKVKASVSNNSSSSKNTSTDLVSEPKLEKRKDISKIKSSPSQSTSTTPKPSADETALITEKSSITEKPIRSTTINSANLKPELKIGDLELSPSPSTTSMPKKSRRPSSQKKKKDKNRKRRPSAEEKIDSNNKENKTKVATKEKPISTQIYNYLAREVMPTVGVGLVGLVVTAGLASYFLYPFGSLRRSYEVDRKDKDNIYYYENEYSPGVPEEEAIGKVIAGMPLYSNDFRQQHKGPQTQKNSYPASNRYRHSDSSINYPKATVEEVQLDRLKDYKHDVNYLQESYQTNEVPKNEPITYNKDIISKNVEATYSISDQQYVVGNIPKEVQEVTPVAVPEHGPRSLKLKRRRREVLKKKA